MIPKIVVVSCQLRLGFVQSGSFIRPSICQQSARLAWQFRSKFCWFKSCYFLFLSKSVTSIESEKNLGNAGQCLQAWPSCVRVFPICLFPYLTLFRVGHLHKYSCHKQMLFNWVVFDRSRGLWSSDIFFISWKRLFTLLHRNKCDFSHRL